MCVCVCVNIYNLTFIILAEIHCDSLEAPSHGSKQGSNETVDSVVTFTCDRGYRLQGSLKRQCTERGTWDGVEPMCVGQLLIHCMSDNLIAGARI